MYHDDLPENPTAEWFAGRKATMRAEIASDREYAQSPAGRLEWAHKQIAFARYEPTLADATKLSRAEAIIAEHSAREQAWTREITIARRAEWNARVKSGEFNARPGKPTSVLAATAERAQGWTMAELRAAVAKHAL